MFYLTKPNNSAAQQSIDSHRDQPFSYCEVGASRVAAPPRYNIDHNRIRLGEGRANFAKAIEAVKTWKMFAFDWIELFPKHAPIEPGVTVGVLVRHLGFWSLNASRIVYVSGRSPTVREGAIEQENAGVEGFGFAYGTLLNHAEQGEERFTVEHHHKDDSVWYDLFAFSKPGHILARVGYPISRLLQKRFARDSLKAMQSAVNT